MRRRLFLFILTWLATVGPVHASFECLPGPTPGSPGDWVGSPAGRSLPQDRLYGVLSLGRPAAIDPLVWAYLSAGREIHHFHLAAEVYSLTLEEIYQESVLGIWGGWRGLSLGLRRWQAGWEDGTERTGWTGSAYLRLRHRSAGLRCAVQDLRLGRSDVTAPAPRCGGAIDLRLDAGLTLAAGYAHGGSGDAVQAELLWSPDPQLTVREAVLFPGDRWTTGLMLRIGPIWTQLWAEPGTPVGPRIGLSVSTGPAPWGS